MSRLEERSNMSRRKTQGRRPPHGETRFGDAPEAGYVEPKPLDPSWITSHQTSCTHEYLTHSYLDFKSTNDNERLRQAIKQLSGKAFSWWKRVHSAQGKSPEEVVTNWEDLERVMIRKYVTTLPTQETRRKYPRRFSNGVSKEAKKVVPKEGHKSLIQQDQIRPSQRQTTMYDQYQPDEEVHGEEEICRPRHVDQTQRKIRQTEISSKGYGPEVQKDKISISLLESKKIVQDTKLSMLLKEAKPVIRVSHQIPEKEPDPKFSHEPTPKWKPKIEQCVVQIPRLKSHQSFQIGHLGDTSDRRSVLGVYLDNQKAFVYETKFTRRLTHQGVIEAWNFKRSFMDQKFMNFTSQRFLILSICEYPTLEGDSSSGRRGLNQSPS
ncbi:hypothetical protein F2Q69_00035843 [Brassica cretica]|uniref:Retrotransposon gag domain-containing protein n=1 Tax=Brassica cretica TaxID=69181 RepID=A0A8S9SJ23_BRACR|nr:hypothetical protein F2Q69_00035843 [Brassica cretica]